MRGSSRLLAVAILLAVVVAAALGYYLWRQWEATRPLPPPKPGSCPRLAKVGLC